tara:strand:- start:5081 stop:5434 length:354 start_codon:yes stop_codon:yes gene_type:complete
VSELKACPFCGFKPKKTKKIQEYGPRVTCKNYNCRMADMKSFSVEDWNKRTTPKELFSVPISLLADISSMCVGELAMGHSMNANAIGQMIYEATGMTQPELDQAARKAMLEASKANQ